MNIYLGKKLIQNEYKTKPTVLSKLDQDKGKIHFYIVIYDM